MNEPLKIGEIVRVTTNHPFRIGNQGDKVEVTLYGDKGKIIKVNPFEDGFTYEVRFNDFTVILFDTEIVPID